MSDLRHLVLQWPRLGPYHLARLRALAKAAAPRDIRVTAIETARRDATYAAIRREEGSDGFERLTLFPDAVFEDVTPLEIRIAVHAALDRLQPDAVGINSYSLPDALATLEWTRRHHRVAVGMTDTKADDGPRTAWRERLKARLVGQFDGLLLAGSPQTRYFRSLGFGGPVDVGYDVVDNAHFAAGADASRAAANGERPFFLAVARLIGVKNLFSLVEAYARYRTEAAAPWALSIVGDGPEREALAQRIAELDLSHLVHLHGTRQIDELPAIYGRAGALVHPAIKDTWGLVVNEAMAAGLPALVSLASGCAEDLVVDGVTGWTFDPLDVEEMAATLARMAALSRGDRQAMGEAARRHIAAWSPERFSRAFLSLADEGRATAARGFDPLIGTLLWALRTLSRSHTSFHGVRD